MKIIRAKNIGFCGGIKKAFEMVEKEFFGKQKKRKVFVLGSLAHNRGVEEKIEEMGIKKIIDLKSVKKGDTVIITAHGAPKIIFDKTRKKKAKIFDTTCPNVIRVQQLAEYYQKKGWQVIIFGDKNHKEVKGILGHCGNKAIVVNDLKETKKLLDQIKKAEQLVKNIVLISQTTKNINIFNQISRKFKTFSQKNKINLLIFDTICRTSYLRQKETAQLAKTCDFSVIIGGAESANTKRLYQIARKASHSVFWIKEIKKSLSRELRKRIKKLNKNSRICVISGASTPLWEISQVEEMVKQLTV